MTNHSNVRSITHRARCRFQRLTATVGVAVALGIAAAVVTGAAAGMAAPPADMRVEDVCAQVNELTDAGRPNDALDLISRIRDTGSDLGTRLSRERADACEPERLVALAALADIALDEPDTPEPAPGTGVADLCALADRLTDDDQPGRALTLIEELRESAPADGETTDGATARACEEERIHALATEGRADLGPGTPVEAAGRSWADSAAAWVEPLKEPALAFLGVLAALLVLARLLVLVPGAAGPARATAARRRLLAFALALVVLAPAGLVVTLLTLAGTAEHDAPGPVAAVRLAFLAMFLVLGLAGAVLLARYLAGRLALAIDVRGAEGTRDEAQTAELIALLAQIGAAPPRGLEVPQGTDVTALAESALPAPAANKAIAALRTVVRVLTGVTPWRVTVDPVGGRATAVVITRNGHAARAVTFDTASWGLPADGVASHRAKLAAAVVLSTLAREHAGFEALCGASDWRGIGLHYIATSDYRHEPDKAVPLLARALDHDPGNRPALVALQHFLHRQAHESGELRRYGDWLRGQSDAITAEHPIVERGGDQDGYIDLHRRILLTYLVTVLNFRAIRGSYSSWPNDAEASGLAQRLISLLSDGTPDSGGLRDAMRPQAATLLDGLHALGADGDGVPGEWREAAMASLAPAIAYNVACAYVRQGEDLRNPDLREKLERALADEHLRDWARVDPELHSLRADDVFREMVGMTPRRDYWDLGLFAPHRAGLDGVGIVNPARLLSRADDDELRRYLSMSKPQFSHLTRVARLVQRAQDVSWAHGANSVSRLQVEVVAELIARGVEVPEDIHPAWVTSRGHIDRTVVNAIASSIQDRTWRSVDLHDLVAWLALVREEPVVPGTP